VLIFVSAKAIAQATMAANPAGAIKSQPSILAMAIAPIDSPKPAIPKATARKIFQS
jgi:hypothetical protein